MHGKLGWAKVFLSAHIQWCHHHAGSKDAARPTVYAENNVGINRARVAAAFVCKPVAAANKIAQRTVQATRPARP